MGKDGRVSQCLEGKVQGDAGASRVPAEKAHQAGRACSCHLCVVTILGYNACKADRMAHGALLVGSLCVARS